MCPTGLDPPSHSIIRSDNDDLACDQVEEETMNKGNSLNGMMNLVVSSDKHMDQNIIVTKQKNGTVSIDVTKALLLLGFANWSGLEEGTPD